MNFKTKIYRNVSTVEDKLEKSQKKPNPKVPALRKKMKAIIHISSPDI